MDEKVYSIRYCLYKMNNVIAYSHHYYGNNIVAFELLILY